MVKGNDLEESEVLVISLIGVIIKLYLRILSPLLLSLRSCLEQTLRFLKAVLILYIVTIRRFSPLNGVGNTFIVKKEDSSWEGVISFHRFLMEALTAYLKLPYSKDDTRESLP